MTDTDIAAELAAGQGILGIEFGSTRIKAVLINSRQEPVATGVHDWENALVDGIWTYPLEAVHAGVRAAFASLREDVRTRYGVPLTTLRALGVSAMMHGYLAFDKDGALLVPFRTWRNTMTGQASAELSALFGYPIPERWSIAHLYQAILNKEPHVRQVASLTTLAGYVHRQLTGQNVLGVGDASGMFPIDAATGGYDAAKLRQFDALVAPHGFGWKVEQLLPTVLPAGGNAGTLTQAGAAWLDAEGLLQPGAVAAAPEGDAGTGMVATNSVAPRTGNVSAGTSVFAMVVLERPLHGTYSGQIDLVATPDGKPAAMAHANNCTGEYDKWIALLGEAATLLGASFTKNVLYEKLLTAALSAEPDAGGLVPYNYLSGESMTGLAEGRPLFVRKPDAHFTLANFMRAQLYTALGALRTGMDILFEKEHVQVDRLTGHGGFFKQAQVGLPIMAAALHTPVSALETAGEGGPWGMALLASYTVNGGGQPLAQWLEEHVFASAQAQTVQPNAADVAGFTTFFAAYTQGLAVERAAVEHIR